MITEILTAAVLSAMPIIPKQPAPQIPKQYAILEEEPERRASRQERRFFNRKPKRK